MDEVIVAIDGPAGTGKSTVSKHVAARLGLPFLDTGAYYRAATLVAMSDDADLHNEEEVCLAIGKVTMDQLDGRMLVDGEDVSLAIRDPAVNRSVSVISAHPRVRSVLVDHQRAWVEMHGGSAVVEGRDIGSVVFPEAVVKIFLSASPLTRAERRAEETGQRIDQVMSEISRRDHLDSSRSSSPLLVPDGAITVDTTDLSVDEVVDAVVASVTKRTS